MFLDEIQEVFLRLVREADAAFVRLAIRRFGQGAPKVVHLALQIHLTLRPARFFLGQRKLLRAAIAVHTVVHQCMAGIEHSFHRFDAMQLLAFGDVGAGVDEIVDDR